MCGQWYNSTGKVVSISQPRKVMENVKEAEISNSEERIYIIKKSGEITAYIKFEETKINNINDDVNATFIDPFYILSNQKIYRINDNLTTGIKFNNLTNFEKMIDSNYLSGINRNINAFIANQKIYIESKPDIARIGEKSNYNLRTVFENAIFVNGNGGNISIVDREGKVYESVNSKSIANNVKKIIASARHKYIITNDNHIYAKGTGEGAMWGDTTAKDEYVEIKDENGVAFDNVKNVFTSSYGCSVIFQTEDNELYFGGNKLYISLPRNNRRFTKCQWE